jgi:hypothetical protein
VPAAAVALLLAPLTGRAQAVELTPPREARTAPEIMLPYGFYDELFGLGGAFVYARRGLPRYLLPIG